MAITLLHEMDGAGLPLWQVVAVQPRFLRSVNLEQDFYTSASLEGYVLTSSGLSALERIAEGTLRPHARAFSIAGAYGSGKSVFAF